MSTLSKVGLIGVSDPCPGPNFHPSTFSVSETYSSNSPSSSGPQVPWFKNAKQSHSLKISRLISVVATPLKNQSDGYRSGLLVTWVGTSAFTISRC